MTRMMGTLLPWLGALLILVMGCDRPAVLVTVTELRPEVRSLRVRSRLEGKESAQGAQSFARDAGTIALRPADTARGTLCVTVEGLDEKGQVVMTGGGDAPLDGTPEQVVTVAMDRPQCSKSGWCWYNPTPQGNALSKVWARNECDAWTVGERGAIVRWNGLSWVPTNWNPKWALTGVWAAGRDDAWFSGLGGLLVHWDGKSYQDAKSNTTKDLLDVWGSGPNDAWAVGADGTIVHWNGSFWGLTNSTKTNTLRAVWGNGPGDIWAVGDMGTVLHWDGSEWSMAADGITTKNLAGVRGLAQDDVWAVGAESTLLHYDGKKWALDMRNVGGNIQEAAPLGRVNVWGVTGGDLVHWQGPGHDIVKVGGLASIFRVRDDLLWTVGKEGQIHRFDGSKWQEVSKRQPVDLLTRSNDTALSGCDNYRSWDRAFWSNGPREIVTVDCQGRVRSWDGERWSLPGPMTTEGFNNVWITSKSEIWAVGGQFIWRWDGVQWTQASEELKNTYLSGIWAAGGNDVWAIGGKGLILRWQGGLKWTIQDGGVSNDSSQLLSIWGKDRSTIWLSGHDGQAKKYVLLSWNGQKWTRTDTNNSYYVIRGKRSGTDTDLWSMDRPGYSSFQRWDGNMWSGGFSFDNSQGLVMDILPIGASPWLRTAECVMPDPMNRQCLATRESLYRTAPDNNGKLTATRVEPYEFIHAAGPSEQDMTYLTRDGWVLHYNP